MPATLKMIAELLSSEFLPDKHVARILFEETIPAALDMEIAELHRKSVVLLKKAHKLADIPAGVLGEAIADVTGEEQPIKSCAACPAARASHYYGTYRLLCTHESPMSMPPLAEIAADVAFKQPASVSRAQLYEMVKGIPPNCPKLAGD